MVMVKLECAGKLIDSIDFISNYLMKLIHGLNGKDKLYQKKCNSIAPWLHKETTLIFPT